MEKMEYPSSNKQESEIENEAESALNSVEEISNQSISAALDTAKIIGESSLSPEQKELLRDRLERNIKKIFRIFTFASVLIGAGGVTDYALTRYKVETSTTNDNEISYSHQDPETTHIINVLSGKENLNESDKRDTLIDYIKENQAEGDYSYVNPDDLYKKSLDELLETANRFIHIENSYGRYISSEEKMKKIIIDPKPATFDPELYSALWKLEQECGNPKIRFRLAAKRKAFGLYNPERSFFDPLNNAVFIDMGNNEEAVDNYVAELSHAKQFNQNPILSSAEAIRDSMKVMVRSLEKEGLSVDSNYNKLYDEPGTLEYSAHKIIESKLNSELDNLAPIRAAKQKEKEFRQDQINQQIKLEIQKIERDEQKILNELFDSYLEKKWKLNDPVEQEKLREKSMTDSDQIRKEFKEKKETIYKKFERN